MAKLMMKSVEETEVNGVEGPLFLYGIDADSYEEAYALAKKMLARDMAQYAEDKKEEYLAAMRAEEEARAEERNSMIEELMEEYDLDEEDLVEFLRR